MIVDRYDPINLFELVPKLELRVGTGASPARSSCSMMTSSSTW